MSDRATSEPPGQLSSAAEQTPPAEGTERLRTAYRQLQERLQTGCTPTETVDILRRLAAYRHRLEALGAAPPASDYPRSRERERLAREAAHNRAPAVRSPQPTGAGAAVPTPPSPPANPTAPPPSASRPTSPPNLVLRFLVEGPDSTDVGSVAAKIHSHFNATWTTAPSTTEDLTIHWLQFQAGSFESAPISFELVAADGTGSVDARHYLRSTVDAIIVVIDAMPDTVRSSTSFVSEVVEDAGSRSAIDRPELTIFAHRSERSAAMEADQVAAELLVESAVRVVATTEEGSGFYYGFAMATNAAVRRAQFRTAHGQPQSEPSSLERLIAPLGGLFDQRDFRHGQERPIDSANGLDQRTTEVTVEHEPPSADKPAGRSRGNRTRRTRALKRLISALRTDADEEQRG